jgi:predicted helicase
MGLYYDPTFVDRPGMFGMLLPNKKATEENRLILCPSGGGRSPFWSFSTNQIPNLNFVSIDSAQCFPLFTYSEDGTHRQENVTPKARTLFQIFYDEDSITREDVFCYVYALLHHPVYRQRFAEILKRNLPRIPLVAADGSLHPPPKPGKEDHRKRSKKDAAVFHAFAKAGRKLADLHINYESATNFPLDQIENEEVPLNWRVEAMKLTNDKSAIVYNDFLTLSGIPPEVFDHKLGNRSALEWVVDQYQVIKDEQDNIISDPNRANDDKYIINLIEKVITVSLETLKTINSLPGLTCK